MAKKADRGRSTANSKRVMEEAGELQAGYVYDFISGMRVRATPEETQAVQVFSRRLVEDLGYPRSHIITRPQYRVHRRPSETKKSYPVDIAVFSKARKHDEDLRLIVECKSPNVKVGRKQLEIYLSMSEANIGVWYSGKSDVDGDTHLYLRKDYLPGGQIAFSQIPTIPRFGQRLEDIGRYLRRDLVASEQLKSVLRDIRNHMAGMATGATRDEPIARQIINVLFCKIYDEASKGPDEFVEFRAGIKEPAGDVRERILDLFARVKKRYADVFERNDSIELDDDSIAYVVGELQSYSVTESKRDVVGDAFEVFMGPALRGEEGQFFTPRNVIHMIVDVLDPQPEEMIIDPACGSGGFLIAALDGVWAKIEARGKKRNLSAQRIHEEKAHVASNYFRGLDKDRFLAKVTKAYMAILGDGRGGVFCENSLLPPASWEPVTRSKVKLGQFDVVMTNPPFGTKIPVKGLETLRQFVLGHKVTLDKKSGKYAWTNKISDKEPPQLLFIERCLQLLKPGGRMGIVIPESILGMPTYTHIVQFLRTQVRVVGVVSMPEDLFQPHTHAKTAVLFLKNVPPQSGDSIFMSIVEWCGHDSRGNPTIRLLPNGSSVLLDDVPKVVAAFRDLVKDFT